MIYTHESMQGYIRQLVGYWREDLDITAVARNDSGYGNVYIVTDRKKQIVPYQLPCEEQAIDLRVKASLEDRDYRDKRKSK